MGWGGTLPFDEWTQRESNPRPWVSPSLRESEAQEDILYPMDPVQT